MVNYFWIYTLSTWTHLTNPSKNHFGNNYRVQVATNVWLILGIYSNIKKNKIPTRTLIENTHEAFIFLKSFGYFVKTIL